MSKESGLAARRAEENPQTILMEKILCKRVLEW
jgi:hypothetical protein